MLAFFILILAALAAASRGGILAFGACWIGYFAIGYWLNRTVLRALVEWHPLFATVESVAEVKGKFLIAWPVKYPALFVQLAASKYL